MPYVRLLLEAGLSKAETQILSFALVLHNHRGLDDAANSLGDLNAVAVITALSCILDISEQKVQKALATKGLLVRSGILKFSRGRMEKLKGTLDLMYGLGNVLFGPQTDNMFNQYFQPATSRTLSLWASRYRKNRIWAFYCQTTGLTPTDKACIRHSECLSRRY